MSFNIPFLEEEEKPQNEAPPTLTEVINQSMKAASMGMRVSCPAKVIKYDKDKQTVDVKLAFKTKGTDGKFKDAPILYSVPVAFPRANSAMIAMPISKDDNVNLVFSDRSLEKWKQNGSGDIENDDDRAHDLSDAIAYVGMYSEDKALPLNNSDDIIIKNDKEKNGVEIRVKKNGHIQIMNNGEELLAVIDDMLRTIREAVVYTSTGAQKLRHTNFAPVQKRLRTFLEK